MLKSVRSSNLRLCNDEDDVPSPRTASHASPQVEFPHPSRNACGARVSLSSMRAKVATLVEFLRKNNVDPDDDSVAVAGFSYCHTCRNYATNGFCDSCYGRRRSLCWIACLRSMCSVKEAVVFADACLSWMWSSLSQCTWCNWRMFLCWRVLGLHVACAFSAQRCSHPPLCSSWVGGLCASEECFCILRVWPCWPFRASASVISCF